MVCKRSAVSYSKLCIFVISYDDLGGILCLTLGTFNGNDTVVDDLTAVYDLYHAVIEFFRRRWSFTFRGNSCRAGIIFNLELTCSVYDKLSAVFHEHCGVVSDSEFGACSIGMIGNGKLCIIPYRKTRSLCISMICYLYVKAVNVKYHVTSVAFKQQALQYRDFTHELDRMAVISIVSHGPS